MDIKVSNYTIHTDSVKNIWITKEGKGESKDGKEIDTSTRVSGYTGTFKETIKDMYRREAFDEDSKDLESALNILDAKMNDCLKIIEEASEKVKLED